MREGEDKLTHSEKLRLAGIRRFGSEEAWRAHLSKAANKANRHTPRGFAVIDPELHKELSRRGGQAYRPTDSKEQV